MKLRVASGVVFNHVGEEIVLLDLNRGVYFGLDPIGARIWQALAEGADEAEIANAVAAEYETDSETALEDVRRLVAELREAGVVEDAES
ncbi:MAG TPA: PqqD family protein [Thermoanaerobaculia bacterium]|nr:PqqD family protein [Thermoanaerobaculia bacterium]